MNVPQAIARTRISVLTIIVALASHADGAAADPVPVGARQPSLVAIQAVNGLFVTVQPDATLAPRSATVDVEQMFDLSTTGTGVIRLKSRANGKYVTAIPAAPLVADADTIGKSQQFRRIAGRGGVVRLRTVKEAQVVCADGAGEGLMMVRRRCALSWQALRFVKVQPASTIIEPAPSSTLRTSIVTFRWQPGADEYWLNVGTAAGGSDIYASGSLGQATEHTVSGLPLSGATLYVELRSRQPAGVYSSTVQYTAAIRKGVLVITDFADRRLEDWTGAGMKSVGDVSEELGRMEDHWAWLSRGKEKIHWDIIRVQLAERCEPGAFPWWGAFRDAVITLAKQQVDIADYDVNSDGVIDASWLIVSSGDITIGDYAIGGTSRNAGANVFVDGQASLSVTSKATGNFNHELSHCLGIVDLYGPYDTIHTLTLMSFSWPVPPPDFTAWEKMKFGWVKPEVVRETRRVWLPSTDHSLAAVMVPTERAYEYFLIEYRHRPTSGYGSSNPDFNGLAVYHVLEPSSMWEDPPILKLEPADGAIFPGNEPIDIHDFASPDNPYLVRPMVLTSYFGGQEVFRLDNIAWRDEGLEFDVVISPPQPSANLLANGSFETGQNGVPDSWTAGSYAPMPGGFVWPSAIAGDGRYSAQLLAGSGNDMWWGQTVTTAVPGQNYMLCGLLKGADIRTSQGNVGANISLLGGWLRTEGLSGTFDWTRRCVTFGAESAQFIVACRLGFYQSTVTGTLWCDDVRLEPVRRAF